MKTVIEKIQKDVERLQESVYREGNELLDRLSRLELSGTVEESRAAIEKLLVSRLKRLEPTYKKFYDEIKKNAAKAGINLDAIENQVLKHAGNLARTAARSRVGAALGGLTGGRGPGRRGPARPSRGPARPSRGPARSSNTGEEPRRSRPSSQNGDNRSRGGNPNSSGGSPRSRGGPSRTPRDGKSSRNRGE